MVRRNHSSEHTLQLEDKKGILEVENLSAWYGDMPGH